MSDAVCHWYEVTCPCQVTGSTAYLEVRPGLVPPLRWSKLSVRDVTIDGVRVTAADIDRIPSGNIRVSRADFAVLWAEAEHRMAADYSDWYTAGVVMTCRWMATATILDARRARPARSPVMGESARAFEELIAKELFEAHRLSLRRPVPEWLADRPRWLDAVIATLEWAWSGTGGPPMAIPAVRPSDHRRCC